MNDFVKEMKQTEYSNPVRENFEMEIDQVGVSNADLAGQFFGGAAEISKDLYGYAQEAERAEAKASAEHLKKLEEQKKAKTQAAYNDFYRKKQRINEAVEQNRMSWTAADTATRRLMDEYSRVEGVEYSRLLQGVEASDFTGSYDREKDTRKFWNNKKNEQQNKVWETMTAANPYLMDIFSPEEGMAWVNTVNDSWDSVERYAAELNTVDQYTNPSKYKQISSDMMRAAGNNIQAALISEIFNEKGKLESSSKMQEAKIRIRDKYLKLGMPAWMVDTSIDIGFRRSGIEAKIDAVNKQHTLNDEDVKRWIKAGQNQFLSDIGATENPYIAMWINTDDFKSGRIYTETYRKANIEMGKRMSNVINGYVNGFTPIPKDIKGEVYGKYSNVVNGNVGTPTLKGYALGDVLADAVYTYGDKDAETRKQAYAEIVKTFDNVYSDATIKALKADADPVKRQLGETVERQLQQIRNLKKFADFEVTPTSAANSWNLLKEGPGMDLLRVNDEGHIVMVDGSKGLLQSTAITLSDATGRYFGAAEDLNKYFSEIYKDPQKRIEMFKDAGVPELDQMKETVIGRKEWYLGTGKAKTEEDVAKEKAVAELDAQWKGRPKTGAYWKARREIEDSFAGETYNLLDLPGDIAEGVGTGLKKAGKGIIKGAQGIGVGINKMLGNKTVWDKPEQELKGTGSYSTSIEAANPRMVPADTESVDFSQDESIRDLSIWKIVEGTDENEYETDSEESQQPVQQLEGYTEPDIIYNTEIPMDIVSDIVMSIESSGNPNAVSKKGAVGLMQLMPKTFKDIAKRYDLPSDDIKDPYTNTIAGKIYLAELDKRFNGDVDKVLSSYNAGPTKVNALIKKYGKNWRRYLPEETKDYLRKYYNILSKGTW